MSGFVSPFIKGIENDYKLSMVKQADPIFTDDCIVETMPRSTVTVLTESMGECRKEAHCYLQKRAKVSSIIPFSG